MIISSIYEHMDLSTKDIPKNKIIKIILRHSIRHSITSSGNQLNVELTNEGKALATHFGKNIKRKIGFLGSSDAKRCIQTLECIAKGANTTMNINIMNHQLRDPHVLYEESCGNSFNELSSEEIISRLKKGIQVPGLRKLKESVKLILDGIFLFGNNENTLDLFCTHDFQIALLAADLFDFGETKDNAINDEWPMMLEGIVFTGERNNFNVFWRNKTKIFDNYLI